MQDIDSFEALDNLFQDFESYEPKMSLEEIYELFREETSVNRSFANKKILNVRKRTYRKRKFQGKIRNDANINILANAAMYQLQQSKN